MQCKLQRSSAGEVQSRTSDYSRIGRRLERGNGHQVGSLSFAVGWDQRLLRIWSRWDTGYSSHRDPQFESNTREYHIASCHYHLIIYIQYQGENAGHQIPVGSPGQPIWCHRLSSDVGSGQSSTGALVGYFTRVTGALSELLVGPTSQVSY